MWSTDGERCEVEGNVTMESQTLKHLTEKGCVGNNELQGRFSAEILAKVLEYCMRNLEFSGEGPAPSDTESQARRVEFFKVYMNTLLDLVLPAKAFGIKSLVDLTCQEIADSIKTNPWKISRLSSILSMTLKSRTTQLKKSGYLLIQIRIDT